jgi:hypothetical protein
LQADIQTHADWGQLPAAYRLVHLSLRQFDYESDLLQRVSQARQAGVRVLVDLDAQLAGPSRLAQLRRQLCQAAGYVRVYSAAAATYVTTLLGKDVHVLVCPVYVPQLPTRPLPEPGELPVVGVYPTDEAAELTYLRATAAYLRGSGGRGVRWTLLGGVGYELDQQQVRVVPSPDFSQQVRQQGEAGLQLALRLYNQRHESLSGLLRRVPKGTPLPPYPFLTVRQNYEHTPANQTYEALAGVAVAPLTGSTTKPSPLHQLQQLRQLDALVLPGLDILEHQGYHALLAGLCAQLGVNVFNAPQTPLLSARQLARTLVLPHSKQAVTPAPTQQARAAQQLQALYQQVLLG